MVHYRLKFNSFELDSEVGRLVCPLYFLFLRRAKKCSLAQYKERAAKGFITPGILLRKQIENKYLNISSIEVKQLSSCPDVQCATYSKPWSLVRSSIFSELSINYIRVTNFSQFLLHQASVHSFKLSLSILKFISLLSLPYWAKDVLASPSVLLSITCNRPRKHDTICTT